MLSQQILGLVSALVGEFHFGLTKQRLKIPGKKQFKFQQKKM